MPKLIHVSLCLILVCLCMACGVRSPEPKYYILTPPALSENTAPAPSMETNSRYLTVGPVILPNYLDRSSIVVRDAITTEITIYMSHLWSEPLEAAFSRLLNTAINRSTLTSIVLPARASFAPSTQLRLSINRFDGAPDGMCTLDLYWFLLDPSGKNLEQGHFIATLEAGNSIDSMVQALSQLVMQFGESIAPKIDALSN